jgi:class 3 adenylate cyclase
MRFGLKFKISGLVILAILIIMSGVAYFFGLSQEETLRSEMRQRASKIAQITGSLSLIQLPGGRSSGWDLTKRFVDVVPQLDANILYIVVVDTDGRLQAAHINRPLLQSLLRRQDVSEEARLLKERVHSNLADGLNPSDEWLRSVGGLLPVEVELRPGGERMGTVGVGFSLRERQRRILQAWLWVGLATLIGMAVGIGASVWLAHSITRPIHALVRGMERVQAGDLSAEVVETSRDEIGMLTRAFNFMTAGLRERERVKKTFRRYVSKDVAERALSSPETVVLSGERRTVSVLFADLRGFTTLSERMQPEEVVAMLNEHFRLMVEVVFKHQGNLDKFMGDALMAEFGAPLSHGDDAHRSVQAAVEMQQVLWQLNERRTARGQFPLAMGIGIATGSVVAGEIGSEEKTEYTVIGDTVNTASRIQGKTAGGQILISEATYLEVKDRIRAEAREPLVVKGKSEPVPVYEVVYG